MNWGATTPELNVEDFKLLRDYIHEKAGIYFTEKKVYLLQGRLVKRMDTLGISSFRDYFFRVKYDTSNSEFNELMNLITTNETYFYRNEPQLEAFQKNLLPEVLNRKRNRNGIKTLKIWSAGCSTGEEPYTIAMILLEELKGETDWRIEIIANDISENVLHKARRGEYSGQCLRYVKPYLLKKYFKKKGDTYCVNTEIKSLVKFVHLNLNETNKLAMYKNLDIIFCRNVMIYFSNEVKKRIIKAYYDALIPNGVMIIGHSETLHGISRAFRLKYYSGSLMYEKAIGSEAKSDASRTIPVVSPKTETGDSISGASRAIELLARIKKHNNTIDKASGVTRTPTQIVGR